MSDEELTTHRAPHHAYLYLDKPTICSSGREQFAESWVRRQGCLLQYALSSVPSLSFSCFSMLGILGIDFLFAVCFSTYFSKRYAHCMPHALCWYLCCKSRFTRKFYLNV